MKINNINLIIKNHFTNSLQNNFDNKKIITYKTKKKYKN